LDNGLAYDDDTNGHIDNWACFVGLARVALAWTDDAVRDAENYSRCRSALDILEASTDARGRYLTVHKLYLPRPILYTQDVIESLGHRHLDDGDADNNNDDKTTTASYVNFYIANEAVIVPQFGDDVFDGKVVETLPPLFPTRKVILVMSREILIGGGNIHCITQQLPKAML
jgi:agmatine deiminase